MRPKIRTRNQGRSKSEAATGDVSFIEAARRDQLVRAAIETLAEAGYARTSFVRIAERARISPGLISYHFRTKGELLAQVVVHVNASIDRAISAGAEGVEGYAPALRAVIEGFVRYCAEHRSQMLALFQLSSNADDAGVKRELTRTYDASLRDFEKMFCEGQAKGELRAFSPRVMAVTVMSALEAVPRELTARPDTDVEAYARELATAFELAVSCEATPPRGPVR